MARKMMTYLLLALLLILPASALDAGDRVLASGTIDTLEEGEQARWILTGDGTLIIRGTGRLSRWSWGELETPLPAEKLVIGEGITALCAGAFENCAGLTQVSLPGSLKTIGSRAFAGCTALAQIRIPEGTEWVEDEVFSGCTALRQVWLADSLRGLGEDVFADTPWLESQADFLMSEHTVLRYIGSETMLEIPEGVTAIGEDCFRDCEWVKSISIPQTVTRVEAWAFEGTQWLRHQGLFPTVNGILIIYQGEEEEVIIPRSVTAIAPRAFDGQEGILSLTVPEGCREIGEYAFSNCSNLKTIQLPSEMSRIGGHSFSDCADLREILLPEGLTRLEEGLFWGCRRLKEVSIPEGVTAIESFTFYKCDKLTELIFPESLVTIEDSALSDAVGLKSIHLPAKAVNVTAKSFIDTFGLTSFTVDENNPAFSVTDGVLYSKDGKTLICCPGGRERDLTIPEGVETVGSYAFYYNTRTQHVTLADSVTELEDRAFYFSGIPVITIPSSSRLERIGDYAFAQCVSLQNLSLPDSVSYLGSHAFSGCVEMKELIVPEGIKRICGPAAPASGVKKVYIHANVLWIAGDAFPVYGEPVTLVGAQGSLAEHYAQRYDLGFQASEEIETSE